jgi:hypothetical protein
MEMTEHDEKMMQQMNKEKEKLILLSITKYGYLAMPQDYKFLRRHSLLNIYLEIVNRSMSGGDTRLLEKTAKSDASLHAASIQSDFSCLEEYKLSVGNKQAKLFLDGNNYYWRTFLSELKKKNL